MPCYLRDMHWTHREIVKLRTRLGMNQREFAERIGVQQPTLSQLESGKRRVQPVLAKLLDCIDEGHKAAKSAK